MKEWLTKNAGISNLTWLMFMTVCVLTIIDGLLDIYIWTMKP